MLSGLKETATLEPTNPYSAAKAGAEMMAKAYLTSYKLPVITTRGNNVSICSIARANESFLRIPINLVVSKILTSLELIC